MSDRIKKIVCFGEVLWDVFPTYQKIGGAPLNVGLRLASFGNQVTMISRIGEDALGDELLDYISKNGLDTTHIQKDSELGTGIVDVSLDPSGSASYEIMYPKAWDRIALTDQAKEAVTQSDAFIFGSLIARDPVSKSSLLELLKLAKFKVFDINLRPPHHELNTLSELMLKADMVKFNDEELDEICKAFGSEVSGIEAQIQFISEETNTESICVTRGGDGAILLVDNQFFSHPGYKVEVADTVGAGDSFLATLIHHLLQQERPENALNFACAVGAMVAHSEGANPSISNDEISEFINAAI